MGRDTVEVNKEPEEREIIPQVWHVEELRKGGERESFKVTLEAGVAVPTIQHT